MSVVTILSAKERKVFDGPPVFTSKERKRWFAFPRSALKEAEMLRTPTTKVCFLTTYGYFRGCNKFFNRQLQNAGNLPPYASAVCERDQKSPITNPKAEYRVCYKVAPAYGGRKCIL